MRRLTFHRILPIVMLALYAVIVAVDHAQLNAQLRDQQAWASDWWHLAFYCINLPAWLTAKSFFILLYLLFTALRLSIEFKWVVLAYFIALGVAVALLWYLVGLWFDRLLGFVERPKETKPGLLRRFAAWTALAGCLVMVALHISLLRPELSGQSMLAISFVSWFSYAALVLALIIQPGGFLIWSFRRRAFHMLVWLGLPVLSLELFDVWDTAKDDIFFGTTALALSVSSAVLAALLASLIATVIEHVFVRAFNRCQPSLDHESSRPAAL